ncbi:MAG: DUF6600 domain-containing protein [Bryobacteraceae bacterium]
MLRRLLVIAAAAAGVLAAQDPPSRAGRISYISGTVSFEPAGVSDWATAAINRPLSMGDQLYVDHGRAEVQIPGTAFSLGDGTSFEFLNLDDPTAQVSLSAGTLDVRVRRMDGNLEVDTPNLAFTVTGPGEYRLDANAQSGQTLVTVRDGEGQMLAGGGTVALHAGQQAVVQGVGQAAQYKINPVPGYDSFDRWVMSRNQQEDRYAASPYVSPGVVGYEDLGAYGTWRDVADYGEMWVPNSVPGGWAPYSVGEWVWMDPWGWTWVDSEPWGFAPFHYGRWAYLNGFWGWCPGPYAVEPIYAPALVAWVGFGGGLGVSIGFGGGPGVGWFALGPRDVYVPPFTASAAFVSRVNLGDSRFMNAGYVNNAYSGYMRTRTIPVASYMNRTAPGAIVAMPQKDFASGQPVEHAARRIPANQVANIRTAMAAPRVAPQTASVLGRPSGNAPHPSAAVLSRPVVSRTRPPAPPPSFAARQSVLARNPGQPIGVGEMHEMARSAPAGTRQAAAPPVAKMHEAVPPQQAGRPSPMAPPQHARAQQPPHQQTVRPAPPTQHARAPQPPRFSAPPKEEPRTVHTQPRIAPPPQQHAHAQPPPHFPAQPQRMAPRPQPHVQAPRAEAPHAPPPERREPEHR